MLRPIELWVDQLQFLPGHEVYRCKLISNEWKSLIDNFEAMLPIPPVGRNLEASEIFRAFQVI